MPLLSGPSDRIAVRFNLKASDRAKAIRFPTHKFSGKRWLEHTSPAVDLAVIPLSIFGVIKELDVMMHNIEDPNDDFLATSNWLEKYKVDPGDQAISNRHRMTYAELAGNHSFPAFRSGSEFP